MPDKTDTEPISLRIFEEKEELKWLFSLRRRELSEESVSIIVLLNETNWVLNPSAQPPTISISTLSIQQITIYPNTTIDGP
jgi:hypothetical protein